MIYAFEEGRRAYRKGVYTNPYPPISSSFKARLWNEGQAFEKARS